MRVSEKINMRELTRALSLSHTQTRRCVWGVGDLEPEGVWKNLREVLEAVSELTEVEFAEVVFAEAFCCSPCRCHPREDTSYTLFLYTFMHKSTCHTHSYAHIYVFVVQRAKFVCRRERERGGIVSVRI